MEPADTCQSYPPPAILSSNWISVMHSGRRRPLHRDVMLENRLAEALPEKHLLSSMPLTQLPPHWRLLRLVLSLLSSRGGVQQGDPLGPLLFCLTLNPVTHRLQL